MVDLDNVKEDAKQKLQEGEDKFQETKEKLFGKNQNGDDDAPDDDDERMMK